jgi:hypothetical protein
MSGTDQFRRLHDHAQRRNLVLVEQLGYGMHGIVHAAKNQTDGEPLALKVHECEKDYRRERDVYLRLQEHDLTDICGCQVPELLDYDDELWVIQMTIVTRPFVLDFAGAYLDDPPDFSEEVLADWRAEKQEEFGPRWAEVQAILRVLEGFGVFMIDANPRNISFGDQEQQDIGLSASP